MRDRRHQNESWKASERGESMGARKAGGDFVNSEIAKWAIFKEMAASQMGII
jgi:hypothetical protein